jgi:hypothetical protein
MESVLTAAVMAVPLTVRTFATHLVSCPSAPSNAIMLEIKTGSMATIFAATGTAVRVIRGRLAAHAPVAATERSKMVKNVSLATHPVAAIRVKSLPYAATTSSNSVNNAILPME